MNCTLQVNFLTISFLLGGSAVGVPGVPGEACLALASSSRKMERDFLAIPGGVWEYSV